MLIDCRTLAYEQAPLRLEQAGLAVVIANSAVKRALAQSAYNERRRECAEAVATLRERLGRPERWVGNYGHMLLFYFLEEHAGEIADWLEAATATP